MGKRLEENSPKANLFKTRVPQQSYNPTFPIKLTGTLVTRHSPTAQQADNSSEQESLRLPTLYIYNLHDNTRQQAIFLPVHMLNPLS